MNHPRYAITNSRQGIVDHHVRAIDAIWRATGAELNPLIVTFGNIKEAIGMIKGAILVGATDDHLRLWIERSTFQEDLFKLTRFALARDATVNNLMGAHPVDEDRWNSVISSWIKALDNLVNSNNGDALRELALDPDRLTVVCSMPHPGAPRGPHGLTRKILNVAQRILDANKDEVYPGLGPTEIWRKMCNLDNLDVDVKKWMAGRSPDDLGRLMRNYGM